MNVPGWSVSVRLPLERDLNKETFYLIRPLCQVIFSHEGFSFNHNDKVIKIFLRLTDSVFFKGVEIINILKQKVWLIMM